MFLQAVSHEIVYWNSNKLRGAAVSVSLSSFASMKRLAFGRRELEVRSRAWDFCLAVVPP